MEFKLELEKAIMEHGKDKIDILVDSEREVMYGGYHSTSNSFTVTKEYPLEEENVIETADKMGIGHSEI